MGTSHITNKYIDVKSCIQNDVIRLSKRRAKVDILKTWQHQHLKKGLNKQIIALVAIKYIILYFI